MAVQIFSSVASVDRRRFLVTAAATVATTGAPATVDEAQTTGPEVIGIGPPQRQRSDIEAWNVGLITKITLATIGVDVSPHLFRTAAVSTAAAYGSKTPHLASALLNHTDTRVTEENYNRVTSFQAAKLYSSIIEQYRNGEV